MKRLEIAITLCLLLSVPAQVGAACEADEARQFDFWAGNWKVSANGKVVGHNNISSIQGGCTLLEEYKAASSAYEGKSFNYYDETDASWHQVWVDNSGLRLHLKGGYENGRMVMSGQRTKDGKVITDRISWHNNDDSTVRQVWDVSEDAGKTWKTVFDGHYERE